MTGASRSVVLTGASRGLGLASAARLYRDGWTVLAAMRSVDAGLARLREATGASPDDPRLVGIRLDLDDPASIDEAAAHVIARVGPPQVLVHNAGIAGVGSVEEMPMDVYRQIFSTNYFGPVQLTKALLPAMREAGHGRIVAVSSQGGARGMPAISAYAGAKAALERWAEALSHEVAPFGLGVTVVVAGTFKTDILELTPRYTDERGPYAPLHAALDRMGDRVLRVARPPEKFAEVLAAAVNDAEPFRRRSAGPDAHLMSVASRLAPSRLFQAMAGRAMGLPRPASDATAP